MYDSDYVYFYQLVSHSFMHSGTVLEHLPVTLTTFLVNDTFRVNLSIAIVAMVKDHSNPNPISNDTQCYIPTPPGIYSTL